MRSCQLCQLPEVRHSCCAATAKKAKAKISAANKAKAAADAALAADAAAAADATAAADVLELARQSVFTRSAASVASPSSAATKNPSKNLYILMFIRFNLYDVVLTFILCGFG